MSKVFIHECYRFRTESTSSYASLDKVLEFVIVRRTRTEISKYRDPDLTIQNLGFPR